ncbi:phage holin family protein [Archangium lipolyticum]|uniref:phage holin family protein n=1 Tax=Archangium lipolyticum TaxID=2970465 RepID=UPI00214A70EC|nr:phage holin family protein [Archangium lipolyticum]
MEERKEQQASGSILAELLTQGRRVARAGARRAEEELRENARDAAKGSALLGASAWMGMTGLSALVIAVAMAMPRNPVKGVVCAGLGLLGGSVALGLLGLRTLPEQPLTQTKQALKEGAGVLKENLT